MNRSAIIDFSNDEENDSMDDLSTQSLSNKIQDALRSAPPFAVIKLPSHAHIQIQGVHLRHPLSIIGRPGTIIEIQNGNIVVDFREFIANNPAQGQDPQNLKVVISETSLIFKYDLGVVIDKIRKTQSNQLENFKEGKICDKNSQYNKFDVKGSIDFSEPSINSFKDSEYGLSYVTFLHESPQTV